MAVTADLLRQIRSTRQAGRWPETLALLCRATDQDARNPDLWNERGLAELNLGQLDAAETSFRKSVRLVPHSPLYRHHLGTALMRLKQWEEAEAEYRRAIELNPQQAPSHVKLAELLSRRNQTAEAEQHYRTALELAPNEANVLAALGAILADRQQFSESMRLFERAAALAPNRPDNWVNLGFAHRMRNEFDRAVTCYRRAIELRPDFARAHYQLGMVHVTQQQWLPALEEFKLAINYAPQMVDAYSRLANVFVSLGQTDQAIECHRVAMATIPNNVSAMVNLGALFCDLDRYDEAEELTKQALAVRTDLPEALNNMGNVLMSRHQHAEALEYYQRALELRPRYAWAKYHVGRVLEDHGHIDEAEEAHRQAMEFDPQLAEARFEWGTYRLLRGDFANGWKEYEHRWRMRNAGKRPRLTAPPWNGGPLEGRRIVVYTEQGFGDAMQFVRFTAQLKQRGAEVILSCKPRMAFLLATCPWVDRVVPFGERLPTYDCHAPLMSLPWLLNLQLEDLPGPVPYLSVASERVDEWREKLARWSGVRVGIVWQGSATYVRDHLRSTRLESFAPLAELPGIQLISLQKGAGVEQLSECAGRINVATIDEEFDTVHGAFVDTAAILKNLDLVIAVDTSLIHLAGALGVPCWVAEQNPPDWRWMLDRSDSPWYPTARVFRQPKPGDWSSLFAEMKVALQELQREKSTLVAAAAAVD